MRHLLIGIGFDITILWCSGVAWERVCCPDPRSHNLFHLTKLIFNQDHVIFNRKSKYINYHIKNEYKTTGYGYIHLTRYIPDLLMRFFFWVIFCGLKKYNKCIDKMLNSFVLSIKVFLFSIKTWFWCHLCGFLSEGWIDSDFSFLYNQIYFMWMVFDFKLFKSQQLKKKTDCSSSGYTSYGINIFQINWWCLITTMILTWNDHNLY